MLKPWRFLTVWRQRKSPPHFVRDYEAFVSRQIRLKPIDQAMSDAVGGSYDEIGGRECLVMTWAGLAEGDALVDFGCGSGRLAFALSKVFTRIDYTGIDIVQRLLDYAKTKCPPQYRFVHNQSFRLPVPDASVDYVACFSVFTHLMPAESFIYLEEMKRILRPGGKIVVSFLEFNEPGHWPFFQVNVDQLRYTELDHLNSMLERPIIDLFCSRLELIREAFVDCSDAPWGDGPMGQSVVVIRKP